MHLIQTLLPLKDNAGTLFPAEFFAATQKELIDAFDGLTSFAHAPAEGVWAPGNKTPKHDNIIVFEIMTETLDEAWWKEYRSKLEKRFRQDKIIIRGSDVKIL